MTEEVAYRFIEALAMLEQHGQVEPLVATFADSCEISNSLSQEKFYGKSGAAQYWENYRASFRHVRSRFLHIIHGDHSIALEWTSNATDSAGRPFPYGGVTILDIAGGKIMRCRAYIEARRPARSLAAAS